MLVKIKYINKTILILEPFIKIVEKFNLLKKDVCISFDNRLNCYGNYLWNNKKQIHHIKISPCCCSNILKNDKKIELDKMSKIYNYISTTLHELKHAEQREHMGDNFFNTSFNHASKIKNSSLAEWYSRCEIEARTYENNCIHSAVEMYLRGCSRSKNHI